MPARANILGLVTRDVMMSYEGGSDMKLSLVALQAVKQIIFRPEAEDVQLLTSYDQVLRLGSSDDRWPMDDRSLPFALEVVAAITGKQFVRDDGQWF